MSELSDLLREQAMAMNKAMVSGIAAGEASEKLKMAALVNALRPFVAAYVKSADHVGDSDLYNEQPRAVYVTLGDCRKAERVLSEYERA